MKRLLSLLLTLMLLLSALPAQAELPETPTSKVAEAFSFMQYAALNVLYSTDEEIWLYAMSQGPYESEGTVRFATADYRYNVAFMPNAAGTGVEEIHILSDVSLVSSDGSLHAYNMLRSILMFHMYLSGVENPYDILSDTLINQVVDVSIYGSTRNPYQSGIVEIIPGVHMSCYRNNTTYAILLEFDTPLTEESLMIHQYLAYTLIQDQLE